jgi:hypothetical protein
MALTKHTYVQAEHANQFQDETISPTTVADGTLRQRFDPIAFPQKGIKYDGHRGVILTAPVLTKGAVINGVGVVTVASVRTGVTAAPEVQTVTVTGDADGGTFTLTYAGQTTGALAPTVNTADLQAALVALNNVAPGDVVVTGDPGAYILTFSGALTGDVAQVTATSSLTLQTPTVTPDTSRGGVSAEDEVQSATITGIPDGGDFTLSFGGQTTAPIAFSADGPAVTAALELLSSIGAGNIVASGSNPAFTLTFGGTLSSAPQTAITANGGGLTGGTSSDVIIAPVNTGVVPVDEIQTVTVALARGGTFTVTYAGQTTGALAFDASTADVQTALQALSNLTPDKVAVTGTPGAYTLTFGGALAATNVAQVTASGVSLSGGTTPEVTAATRTPGVAAVIAEQSVTITGPPPSGTWDLSFGGVTTAELAIDVTAVDVEAALNALAGFPGVTVAGDAGGPFTVTFDTAGPRALFTTNNTFPGGLFVAGNYFWVVTVVDEFGGEVKSNEVTASLILHDSQVLSWTAVPHKAAYKVYRGVVTATENHCIATVTGLTYTDNGTVGTSATPAATNTTGDPVPAPAKTTHGVNS